ncbi:YheC/YheD family protein [Paenibacillus athensensis]|uniref:ATP-grasp domain-containing protein n=1 Tax=Paenibacillus athensensis TaxID=1967502 RepID=A0A4Y8PX67_9BACL|nr:YheC/YheD family protein [Paenibacillus athensensis]MCD1258026.1 YheC/YheD family protein [Paenibacillus athensensis]
MMIGLYSPSLDWLTPQRVASWVRTAEEQGVQLFFFTPSGLDESSESVQGIVYSRQGEQRQRLPVPACVIATPGSPSELPAWRWMCRHTTVIGTELSILPEESEIGRFPAGVRRGNAVATAESLTAAEGREASAQFRCTLSRTVQGGWKSAGIELLAGGAVRSAQMEGKPDRLLVEAYLLGVAIEMAEQIAASQQTELPGLYVELELDERLGTCVVGAGIAVNEAEVCLRAISHAAQLTGQAGRMASPVQRLAACLLADKPTIGMLVGWELSPLFLEACHYAAEARGARFFYFYPRRVDIANRQIQGHYWQNGQWRKALFPYPDVIYDRMRRKNAEHAAVYEALTGIPITHELLFGSLDKLKVYQAVAEHPVLSASIIPFHKLDRLEEAKRFIDRHPHFILKPLRGSNGDKMIIGTLKENGRFEICDQDFVHDLSREELDKLLAELRKHRYVVQKFIESQSREGFTFHVRAHAMKDGNGRWDVAFVLPSFSLNKHRQITNHVKTFRCVTKWEWFLKSQFGQTPEGDMNVRVRSFAVQLATFLEGCFGSGFHEAGIDMGIDEHGAICLFEVNLNNVGMNLHELEAAKYGIEYALWLLASSKG